MTSLPAWEKLLEHVRQTALLESTLALLSWDEHTYLPDQAGPYRAEQSTLLAGMIHERNTAPQFGEWLGELGEAVADRPPHDDQAATVRELTRKYRRAVRLPRSLVEELERTKSLAQQAWVVARKADDFASFRPWLERIFALKRQEAEAQGYEAHPYDALLEDYEPGATTAELTRVLGALREDLTPLVAAVINSGRKAPIEVLHRDFPVPQQEALARKAATAIGFDFQRGRLDVTAHPFCMTSGPHDCRLTTRYFPKFFNAAFFGVLHEAGHGLYEQGLRPEHFGMPPGQTTSLGIHESQSRMWENLVGRSRPFWEFLYPEAQSQFPALADVPLDDFYFAVNDVRPSLIRVEADEATYNLHIIIRFELEQALLRDELQAADVPGAWNEKYQQYLGVQSPTAADGLLQDIHWSAGLVGYFPTYSLGNLYAAQFFDQAEADLGPLADRFRRGEFAPLRAWLREKIHVRGMCYRASELVQEVTGRPLSHRHLLDDLREKLTPLYGL